MLIFVFAIEKIRYGGYGVGVNTSGCGPEDRGFKSHHSPQKLMGLLVSFFCAFYWFNILATDEKDGYK